MRIAILADVHANLPAFRAVLKDAKNRGCRRVYHAGDLISIGPYPAEVVDLARSFSVQCVLGNHEEWIVRGLPSGPIGSMQDGEFMHQHWIHSRLDQERRDFIRSMPYRIADTIGGVRVQIVHFALASSGQEFKSIPNTRLPDAEIFELFDRTETDLICFGHIHPRQFNAVHHGCHFLDPGSVGCTHDGHAPYATVNLDSGRFEVVMHRVHYDRHELLDRYDQLDIPDRDLIRKHFLGMEKSELLRKQTCSATSGRRSARAH